MKRWNTSKRKNTENPAIDRFLAEIDDVCKKHGFEIGHEDWHGAFEIHPYQDGGALTYAHDCTEVTS